MNDTTKQDNYLKNRVDDQIDWFNKKSSYNQKMYKRLQLASIIAAALIPFFTGYLAQDDLLKYVVGMLGVLVTVFAGMNSLFKYQEIWISYRTTCEALQYEKYLFVTGTKPYNTQGSFNLLVERVESILSNENSNWSEVNKTQAESEG